MQQGIKTVIPAWAQRTNPQTHDPARHAVEKGRGWYPHGRRVATRDAPYAHPLPAFFCTWWAMAGIWLNSNLNATWLR